MEKSTIKLLGSYDKFVKSLDLSNKNIVGLLDLEGFVKLEKLICSHNKITEIKNIKRNLKHLDCSYNLIKELTDDHVNKNLDYFNCKSNPLIKLHYPFDIKPTSYPKTLTHLTFGWVFNQPIDNLPKKLTYLRLGSGFNQPIDNLPTNINITYNYTEIPHSDIINCFNKKDFSKKIICSVDQFYYINQLYQNKKKLKKINFLIYIEYDPNINRLLNRTDYHEDCYHRGYDNCKMEDYISDHHVEFLILFDKDEKEELLSAYVHEDFDNLESGIVELLNEKYKNYKLSIKFNQK